jgi:hypothetical protein
LNLVTISFSVYFSRCLICMKMSNIAMAMDTVTIATVTDSLFITP